MAQECAYLLILIYFYGLKKRLDSSFVNKDEKEEKKEELEFAESIYKILDSSTTKEEFLRLAKAKLREYKNPGIEDTLQSILNLAI